MGTVSCTIGKALATLGTSICLAAQATGQSLQGHWTGSLPQDDKTYVFRLEVDIQQHGQRLRGQARLTNNTGAWVVQRFQGEVVGKKVAFREVEVVKLTPFPDGVWCLKNFSGIISQKQGRLYITGTWSSTQVYDGKYVKGECAPGKFSLSKPLPRPRPSPAVAEKLQASPTQVAATAKQTILNTALNEPFTLKNVLFVLSKDVLLESSKPELDALVLHLQAHPNMRVFVAGHADRIGDPRDNLRLSRQRAQAVKNYLVSQQIDAQRITADGYGDIRPVCPPPCQENRRVEFTLSE